MKIKTLYKLILLSGILFVASSCLDSDNCVEETYSSPKAFNLKLVDGNGTNLISDDGYNIDSIDLYYSSNLGSTRVAVKFQELSDGYLLASSELPYTILETANEQYFLYLNYQDTDTLTISVLRETDGCNIWHRYVDCKYNGALMDFDTENYAYLGVK